ncbi:uncharacterized protein YbbC (DUF1343 family) [Dysgonomonas sp. PH5-45]|nr:uncharacterized protein YbbC (DUF1343 family) [Dysgonomonas sp. PH5-45]MDH6387727.1 uncharacterized protein YbbC (DUF1343 family) [Dysgonomonas sp. PH5-37]
MAQVKVGADCLNELLPLLKDKQTAIVANQTSCLNDGIHLVDALLTKGISITKIFAPEHGFRGMADAGERVLHGKDSKTGLQLISLYGKNYKPTKQQLEDTDIVVFDIQDVGARFYTYITTMHYVMQACAENNKLFIVLDRPNPNDHIDGPVLNMKFTSFVGKHPIPILHGLTIGELALMINGEGWLSNGLKCDLKVIPVKDWKHGQAYSLPIKPSPNLPNDQAIRLYPSLCFFEATKVSVGRGTEFPFQAVGYPNPKCGSFKFTPRALEGSDKNPLQKNRLCYGIDLRKEKTDGSLTLKYLISFYKSTGLGDKFFSSRQFMNMLAGTDQLRLQIQRGMTEKQIRKSWQKDLDKYKQMRSKYLLYKDER